MLLFFLCFEQNKEKKYKHKMKKKKTHKTRKADRAEKQSPTHVNLQREKKHDRNQICHPGKR